MGAALGFGLIVGALLGLVGGGGSILAVPALVYGVGMPLSAAVPSSLVIIGASSAVAVLPRVRRDVSWHLALIIGVTGAATAFAGSAMNRLLDQQILLLIFSLILIVAGIRMFIPTKPSGNGDCYRPDGTIRWRRCLPKTIAIGAVVGFLTGLLGVGGGFLLVPALTLVLGAPMSVAVGTSLVVIVINSIGGFISYMGQLDMNWTITSSFATTAMAASLVATRIGRSLPDRALKRGFAALAMLVAVFVAAQALLALGVMKCCTIG